MAQGSSVTHRSQPSRRQSPSAAAAARIATISAWAVGIVAVAHPVARRPTPRRPRTTAPTGTSPAAAAARGLVEARRIGSGRGSSSPPVSLLRAASRRCYWRVAWPSPMLTAGRLHPAGLPLHYRNQERSRFGLADGDLVVGHGHGAVAVAVHGPRRRRPRTTRATRTKCDDEQKGPKHVFRVLFRKTGCGGVTSGINIGCIGAGSGDEAPGG